MTKNWSIGLKLALTSALGIALALSMVIALIVLNNSASQDADDALSASNIARDLVAVEGHFRGIRLGLANIRLATDQNEITAAQTYLDAQHDDLIEHFELVEAAMVAFEDRAHVEAIAGALTSYMALVPQMQALAQNAILQSYNQAVLTEQDRLQKEFEVHSDAIRASVKEGVAVAEGKAAQEQAIALGKLDLARTVSIALGSLLVLLMLGTALFGRNSVARPIGRITDAMSLIANGRLETQIPFVGRGDEIGKMASAVKVFRENGARVAALGQEEAERARLAADRADMMERFQLLFDAAIEGAVQGDFSRQISESFNDVAIDRIVANFNEMLSATNMALTEAGGVLAALADTDLTKRMAGSYRGAFAKLKGDTNEVADKLINIVSGLRTTSTALRTATGEILAGANDLSERTTRQAAAIEETSAATEQLTTAVSQNATRAIEALGKSQAAAALASEGGVVMSNATNAMDRIAASSAKVSDIIGMIDDIAFQTNLLALNASVEAARAGEAGKGFAVVAVEVRRLAQSAALASSEVKTLIEQSTSEVTNGSRLVASAASKLEAILQSVQDNAALMQNIAEANKEQSSAIFEVREAVRQMDEMTQHNAALVEETNAAIEQTEAQARDLDLVVEQFRVSSSVTLLARQDKLTAYASDVQKPQSRSAAKSYIFSGSNALESEWSEF